jgi:hypothetical protein
MTAKNHKLLLAAILGFIALALFASKELLSSIKIVYAEKQTAWLAAKTTEEANLRTTKGAEEANLRTAKEAEEAANAEQKLNARRAAIPEFSFSGFRLSDTPEQVIGKGWGKYKITTSFPVDQLEFIKMTSDPQNFGVIEAGVDLPLEQFFSHHPRIRNGYNLSVSDKEMASALRINSIHLQEKEDEDTGIAGIQFYFFMLPDGSPKALYMRVTGSIVRHVPEVFGKRYGEPEHTGTSRIWISDREVAIVTPTLYPYTLYIISKAAYDEYVGFVAEEAAKIHAKEDAIRKAADKEAQRIATEAAEKAQRITTEAAEEAIRRAADVKAEHIAKTADGAQLQGVAEEARRKATEEETQRRAAKEAQRQEAEEARKNRI